VKKLSSVPPPPRKPGVPFVHLRAGVFGNEMECVLKNKN
jgi:hypothetical protein